jgi:transposase
MLRKIQSCVTPKNRRPVRAPYVMGCVLSCFESPIRELERLVGRKTMEAEILKEALAKAQAKQSLQLVSELKDASR